MSDKDKAQDAPDRALIESVWAQARDLVKRLEGSSVQRLSVAAGEYKIEIERGAPAPAGAPAPGAPPPLPSGPVAPSAGPGLTVGPGARMASGVFSIGDMLADTRVPVLAPLVGTFYESDSPGNKPFVSVGDTVEPGQTLCIVEAMKMLNQVASAEAGKVAEIVVKNGERVEFEQVLMYLEPPDALTRAGW